ncbi:hypothetical protein [Bradyrhizobium betae]|uniref:Uncharacterized protein n=1 Tax=Bradyrhizobium betae TaxID=244734 RepID=A0A4Q1UG60_9BRAD|nr:hypothetical protein [Bradyrhizobium betae]RXT33684.1 hypothetical protein B5V03_39940 [Bradyrhizobium betae]
MSDETSDFKFVYQDKHGKVSTNRPQVVQWAVSIKMVLQGLAAVIMACGITWALYVHGGSLVKIATLALGKL